MKGKFVTFEGGEGTGKTTQMKLAGAYLMEEGHKVVLTREPGGTVISERIRKLILDPGLKDMEPRTELLLYLAARAQHVSEVISPAIEAGKIVLCDRFADATAAYQGFARGIGIEQVSNLNEWTVDGRLPDLTFMFFLDVEDGLARETDRDRFHKEGSSFHRLVDRGYRMIARSEKERVVEIEIDGLDIPHVFRIVKINWMKDYDIQ